MFEKGIVYILESIKEAFKKMSTVIFNARHMQKFKNGLYFKQTEKCSLRCYTINTVINLVVMGDKIW